MTYASFALSLLPLTLGTLAPQSFAAAPQVPCPANVSVAMKSWGAADQTPFRIEGHYDTITGEKALLRQEGLRVSWEVEGAEREYLQGPQGQSATNSEELVHSLGSRLNPAPTTLRPREEMIQYSWINELGSGSASSENGEWVMIVHQGIDKKLRYCSPDGCTCE